MMVGSDYLYTFMCFILESLVKTCVYRYILRSSSGVELRKLQCVLLLYFRLSWSLIDACIRSLCNRIYLWKNITTYPAHSLVRDGILSK